MKTQDLLSQLKQQTESALKVGQALLELEDSKLKWRPNPESWNILECIEHLNLYGDYYLPEMEKCIKKSTIKPDLEFRSGLLGGYFAKLMLPKEKLNKMKTFKDKNPMNKSLDRSVIEKFNSHQLKFLEILELSRNKNLNKIKIQISISKWIKMNLGDTFLFYMNHILRHLEQIEKVKALA